MDQEHLHILLNFKATQNFQAFKLWVGIWKFLYSWINPKFGWYWFSRTAYSEKYFTWFYFKQLHNSTHQNLMFTEAILDVSTWLSHMVANSEQSYYITFLWVFCGVI